MLVACGTHGKENDTRLASKEVPRMRGRDGGVATGGKQLRTERRELVVFNVWLHPSIEMLAGGGEKIFFYCSGNSIFSFFSFYIQFIFFS